MDFEEILQDPTKFGAPTFEEFSRCPEKYLGRDDDALSSVDNVDSCLKNRMKKVRFEIEGFRCRTIEEVERVALANGIPVRELDYTGHLIPQGGGEFDVLIKFISKAERERRSNW